MSWQIDPAHSQIDFSARHMMISTVRGRFENFTGRVEFDEADPSHSLVDVQIEAASVNTRVAQRDDHLRSPDFLDAEKYPHLTFKSKHIKMTGPKRGRLIGDLTIRDVTREVALDVEYLGQMATPWGTTSAGFNGSTTINRKDWGLTWNQVLEAGALLVSEDINIRIELELIKQPAA